MSIFKKQKPDFDDDLEENEITAGHVLAGELDEKTKKQVVDSNVADSEYTDDMPSANAKARKGGEVKTLQKLAIGIVALLVVLLGLGATVSKLQTQKEMDRVAEAEKKAEEQKKMANGTVDVTDDIADIKSREMFELPPPAAVEAAPEPVQAIPPQTVSPIEPVQIVPPQSNPEPVVEMPPIAEPVEAILAPPIKGSDSNVLVDVNAIGDLLGGGEGSSNSRVGGNLNMSNLAKATATRMNDKSMLLLKGTTIPCVLKTRIDSTYQGFTVCQTMRDVYSSNGKTLVLERGSQVFGEHNVDIKKGQARVSIAWGRVDTPKGVSVNINSPATDALGAMGVNADVDNHFFKKFGASIMLSIIEDGLNIASSHLEAKDKNGEGSTTINSTTNSAETIAELALEDSIDIEPTASINQGAIINIMVARDVDFSDVYRLGRR